MSNQVQVQAEYMLHPYCPSNSNINNTQDHISLARKTLEDETLTDGERAEALDMLARALFARAQSAEGVDRNDVDEALRLLRQAILLRTASHPNLPKSLGYLANVLFWSYVKGLDGPYNLEEAISLGRKTVEMASATHTDLSTSLCDLASFLRKRYDQGRAKDDAIECMHLYQKVLEIPSAPDHRWHELLRNLGHSVLARYKNVNDQIDLDQLILIRKAVVQLLPQSHHTLPDCLFELGYALEMRFRKAREWHVDDLNESISCYRRSLDLQPIPPADMDTRLDNLADLLIFRFEETQDKKDLNEFVSLYRKALEMRPEWHADRAESLKNLGKALYRQFTKGCSTINQLNECISLQRQCVQLRPAMHPGRSDILFDLATSLDVRFDRIRERCDFEEAFALYRESLTLTYPVNPEWADTLKNLAFTLVSCYGDESGEKSDIEKAVAVATEALRIREEFESMYEISEYFNQLGHALLVLIRDTDEGHERLEECISLHRRALQLRPHPHIERVASLSNLATSLFVRFKNGGTIDDLTESISLYRLCLRDEVTGLVMLCNMSYLADALEARFDINNVVYQHDIHEATALRKEADELEAQVSMRDIRKKYKARQVAAEKMTRHRHKVNQLRRNNNSPNYICDPPLL
ncbi:hypothetical protein JR316_0002722 [Psilocybe cubensis]|uniref:Uncharacterized protein n=2 Tax=Psilocybe cubensis TaxID=181762 RepID=A0ACB8HDM1_PSICU|nr:hypothetical protein JR316_0002722 [Psilocybe cubensis]KAH9485807.1 hypothetical protein JR316_0002722 [Psilocybe cubensis]